MFNPLTKTRSDVPRRLVIGDVHGHYDGLMGLLQDVRATPADRLYFLGDLIDRGPKSASVVKFVRENKYPCLLGNHEVMMLRAVNGGEPDNDALQIWVNAGGLETIQSYGSEGILQSDIDWMGGLPRYLDLDDAWLVHAGVDPYKEIGEQDEREFCWIRERFFSAGFPYFRDKVIITGHTLTFTLPGVPAGEIAEGPGWINIETGAYHKKSGWMTALDLDNQYVYQFNVFTNKRRQQPLEKSIHRIDPLQVKDRKL
jgi:serine/threonine protein phosphatase 1